ncbi:hypothetical protein MMC13_007811 [Lambiella insularis]|nr:hypothetical protein [Lambiella insularis]
MLFSSRFEALAISQMILLVLPLFDDFIPASPMPLRGEVAGFDERDESSVLLERGDPPQVPQLNISPIEVPGLPTIQVPSVPAVPEPGPANPPAPIAPGGGTPGNQPNQPPRGPQPGGGGSNSGQLTVEEVIKQMKAPAPDKTVFFVG